MTDLIKTLFYILLAVVCITLLFYFFFEWQQKQLPPPRPMFAYDYREGEMGFGKAWSRTTAHTDSFGAVIWFDFQLNLVVVVATEESNWRSVETDCTPERAILLPKSKYEQLVESAEDKLIVIVPNHGLRKEFHIEAGMAIQWHDVELMPRNHDVNKCMLSTMIKTFRGSKRDEFCQFVQEKLPNCKQVCP